MIRSLITDRADRPQRASQGGFTLVELMVGLLLGLLVTLAVIGSLSILNSQRRTTVAGSEAQENALTALSLLERAARLSGAGLFYNGQLLCPSINIYYDGKGTLADGKSLMPVKIVDGGATGSDSITFTYAEAVGGSGNVNVVDDMPTSSANFTVNHQGSLKVGDLALIGVPGSSRPCTLFQVTGFPPGGGTCGGVTSSCVDIQHNPGVSGKYNPANPGTAFTDAPRYGYVNNPPTVIGPAVISRIGTLVQDTYEVKCNTLVSHGFASGAASCTSASEFTNATPQVADIVQIQAQYGITASASSDEVTDWVDATGATWTTPDAANVPRIKAIRIAVVSRSREWSRTEVSSACTNSGSVANTGPCSFQDAKAPVIDLSAVAVPSGATWRNFRYRVYQTVIPLRNVAWNY